MKETEKIPSDEKEYLYLLHEQRLSNMMTNFYLAIIQSNENTKLLQTEDPWEIDPVRFKGPYLTRDSMNSLCEWLERIKIFTKSEEIYKDQFLEPIRLIAKMVERWRTMDKRSTDLEGWVFSKSRPTSTSNFQGEKKSTVSAVIPKLQSVMSVSVSESIAKQITSEYFTFGGCQPVGLVNRIHQVGSENRQTQKKVLLSEFDFLFTAYDDIKNIGRSIEMENFCEVESVQSNVNHHMGFPFISFAKVLQVTSPQVTLQELDGTNILKIQMSNHYYKNAGMEDPKKLQGKYVRFFGVQWYRPRSKNAVNLERPEMFLMQEEKDVDRLRFENVVGMIRLRCRMAQSEVEKILGKKIDSNDCIKIEEGTARFRYSGSYDKICAEFIETMSKIRNLREKFKLVSSQVTEEQVIDEKKTNIENLTSFIKHHRELFDILLDYKMQFDLRGEYSIENTVSSLKPLPEGIITKKINLLKYLEVFEQEKEVRLTEKGFNILTRCAEDELNAKFSSVSRGIIEIDKIQNEGIPPSVLLGHLRKGNVKGYSPTTLGNQKTEMYWTYGGKIGESIEKIISKYEGMRNRVLEIMRSVSHPVTTQWISEMTKNDDEMIGNFVVSMLLEETEITKRIKRSGDSWEYTIRGRLYDLFQTHPEDMFDMDLIFKMIKIGTMHKDKVTNILHDFENTKTIFATYDGWTFNTNMDKKIRSIINPKIEKSILLILEEKTVTQNRVKDRYLAASSQQSVDVDIVVDRIKEIFSNSVLLELIDKNELEVKQVIEDVITMMIDNGTIIQSDGMLSKK